LPTWRYLDPEGFLAANPGKAIIDHGPPWVVDRARRPGPFVLTGSAMPSLMTQAAETLAGRIGVPSRLALRWFWGG